jgi:hypothetical protein
MIDNGRILLLEFGAIAQASGLNSAACDQVDDQYDHSQHQQNVDKATGNVKAEAQKPQDQQNRENCPKH